MLDEDVEAVVLSVQWNIRTDASPVFIRVHFLPFDLHDFRQAPNSFPFQVDFVVVDSVVESCFFPGCTHCHLLSARPHLSLYFVHSLLQSVNFSKVFLPSFTFVSFSEFSGRLGVLPIFDLQPYVRGFRLIKEHLYFLVQ